MSRSFTFNVYQDGKKIDTVFDTDPDPKEVRHSLISHDGYDHSITVRRVWETEYVVQSRTSIGFEDVTSESSAREAVKRWQEYRENEPGTMHRIVTRKVQS
jgi:hypothetical protein